MTQSSWLWDLAAWLSLPILAILSGVMARTRRYKDFPFFFLYVLIACLVGVIRFVIYKRFSQIVYYYSFWATDSIIAVSAFLAIYEVFIQRTFPQFFRIRLYRFLIPSLVLAAVFLAFLTALVSPNQAAALFIVSRTFDFLRAALVGLFIVLMLLMGRSSGLLEFSIAFGFGIQAAVTLISAALTTRANYRTNVLARFELVAFDFACVIWLAAFLFYPELRNPQTAEHVSPERLQQARSWEKLLKDWLSSKKKIL
jgi:hypothetical protein